MKLRIKGNTLRLRLTKSEVEYFGNTLFIEERTAFRNNSFTYSLQTHSGDSMNATFDDNKLIVSMPDAMTKKWISTNLVGCNGEVEVGEGKKLYLLVEKDFKCLDETVEDQSDNYENPLAKENK